MPPNWVVDPPEPRGAELIIATHLTARQRELAVDFAAGSDSRWPVVARPAADGGVYVDMGGTRLHLNRMDD